MARTVTLQRSQVENANHWHLRALRLKVEVTAVTGDIETQIFVFQRRGSSDAPVDYFVGVASPVDMVELPANAPEPTDGSYPFYRRAEVELDIRSTQQLEEVWEAIKTDTCQLTEAMDRLDELTVIETHECSSEE